MSHVKQKKRQFRQKGDVITVIATHWNIVCSKNSNLRGNMNCKNRELAE